MEFPYRSFTFALEYSILKVAVIHASMSIKYCACHCLSISSSDFDRTRDRLRKAALAKGLIHQELAEMKMSEHGGGLNCVK